MLQGPKGSTGAKGVQGPKGTLQKDKKEQVVLKDKRAKQGLTVILVVLHLIIHLVQQYQVYLQTQEQVLFN
tara:strand:+ start:174 stop:386 length:213 start_codon:yes stop_codon:yes gene_type:complete